jgi:hypothetical protein
MGGLLNRSRAAVVLHVVLTHDGRQQFPVIASRLVPGEVTDPLAVPPGGHFLWGNCRRRMVECVLCQDDAVRQTAGIAHPDLAGAGGWSFTAFYEQPILRASDALRFTPRSHFLVEKASPTGMFWAIDRARRLAGNDDHQAWARLFGKAVEVRGHKVVADHVQDPSRLLDEDALKTGWPPTKSNPKTSDLLVRYPDAWLAIDFVHRSPTRASLATGAYADLVKDIERAVLEKLLQIDDTLARCLGGASLPQPSRLFPIVVIGAAFPSGPLVAIAVSKELEARSLCVTGADARCRRPSVLDLFELRILVDAAAATGTTLPGLLDSWIRSSLEATSLRSWLATEGSPQALYSRTRHAPGSPNSGGTCSRERRLDRQGHCTAKIRPEPRPANSGWPPRLRRAGLPASLPGSTCGSFRSQGRGVPRRLTSRATVPIKISGRPSRLHSTFRIRPATVERMGVSNGPHTKRGRDG